jgi:hemolysin activation/secretion protein
VLHLPTLEGQLALLKSLPGVGQLRASISKLGSDPRQGILTLTLQRQVPPWQGLFELRNDGNSGTGQWRSLATVVKNDLAFRGDTLLFYGEIDGNSTSEFGVSVGSISYTLPLGKQLKLINSIGVGRSQIIEGDRILRGISYQQLQNFTQLEWTIKDSLNNNINVFAGLSASRLDGFLNDQSAPVVFGGGAQGWLSTGYIRAGISFSSIQRHWLVSGSLYGLQGLTGFSSEQQLAELSTWGIDPNRSRALAGQLGFSRTVG